MLESAATLIDCDKEYLMCLTSCGLISTWNVIRQVAVVSSVSVAPILQSSLHLTETTSSSVSITSATVRQDGLPLLTTSSGQGFSYHDGMKTWVKVIDPWFAMSSFFGSDPTIHRAGAAVDAFGESGSAVSFRKGVLAQMHAAAMSGRQEKDAAFAQELLRVDETVQGAVTLSHLEVWLLSAALLYEACFQSLPTAKTNSNISSAIPIFFFFFCKQNQMASAKVLGSASEYRQWLRCYTQRLADESAVDRVEELCKYLLGPIYQG